MVSNHDVNRRKPVGSLSLGQNISTAKMKKVIYISILLAATVLYNANARQLNETDKTAIDEYLEGLIKEGAPGLAVGVISKGEVVYENYLGLANLEHKVPVDQNSRFNIASVAKEFTALATLRLSLEGKLSLEDDIRKYLPEIYPEVQDSVRIRHLINHSSGIRDYCDLMSVQRDPWWRREGLDNKDVIELLSDQRDLGFKPGTERMYSNSNYTLLAEIVAVASGQSFHEYTGQMFQDLGMANTSFQKKYMHVIPYKATPYADWGNGIWQEYPMITSLYGDGFLFTTLKDQLAFEQQVQQSSEALLTQSQKPIPNSESTAYGFGLELEDRLGYRAVHHSGSTGAYHAQVVRFPNEQLSIMVMSNNSTIWSGFIADKIGAILLPNKEVVDESLKAVSYDQDLQRSTLLGEYETPKKGIRRIIELDGALYWKMDNNNPIEIEKVAGSLYQWVNNTKVKLGFSQSGFTLHYPDSEPKFYTKLAPFYPSKNYLNELIGDYYNEEIDVRFKVSLDENGALQFTQKGRKRPWELEIIQQDQLLASDYILRPKRNEAGKITDLLLTYSRLKNIRLEKVNSEISRTKKYTADGGCIQVGTTSAHYGKGKGDILLTKNDPEGNEEWFKSFGGTGYDKASSVELTADGGYLIVGSTSSFGNGNYDAWVIKVDQRGKEEWSKTFGGRGNEYGYQIKQDPSGFILVSILDDLQGEKKIIRFTN